jgi:hypothetical protein
VPLRLDGVSVLEGLYSAVDGWASWEAQGFHAAQLNIPPSKSRDCEFYRTMGEYEPSEKRRN